MKYLFYIYYISCNISYFVNKQILHLPFIRQGKDVTALTEGIIGRTGKELCSFFYVFILLDICLSMVILFSPSHEYAASYIISNVGNIYYLIGIVALELLIMYLIYDDEEKNRSYFELFKKFNFEKKLKYKLICFVLGHIPIVWLIVIFFWLFS